MSTKKRRKAPVGIDATITTIERDVYERTINNGGKLRKSVEPGDFFTVTFRARIRHDEIKLLKLDYDRRQYSVIPKPR